MASSRWRPRSRTGPADLRFQAATSLAEIDREARVDRCSRRRSTTSDPQVVGAAALSLGAIGETDAIALLVPRLEHADPARPVRRRLRARRARRATRARDAGRRARRSRARVGRGHRARQARHHRRRRGARRCAREQEDPARGDRARRRQAARDRCRTVPHHDAARRVLIAALGARKVHVRGLAVEQLGEIGGAWATAPAREARAERQGRGAARGDRRRPARDRRARPGVTCCSTRTRTSMARSSTPTAPMSSRGRAPPGVQRMVVIGAVGDPTSAERSVALAEADPDIWATVATHPHDVEQMTAGVVGRPRAARPAPARRRDRRDRARLLLRSLAARGAAGRVRAVPRARPPRAQAGGLSHPRRPRRRPRDPEGGQRGRARLRDPLLHRHAR